MLNVFVKSYFICYFCKVLKLIISFFLYWVIFIQSAALSELICPKSGGVLKYGVKAEPPTYDMHRTNSYAVMHFVAQHYSTLLTFDWNRFPKLEGDVAENWKVSDDGLTYTFFIRRDVRFY